MSVNRPLFRALSINLKITFLLIFTIFLMSFFVYFCFVLFCFVLFCFVFFMFLAAWKQVFEKVQEARIDRRMKLVPFAGSVNCPFYIHYHLCCLIFVILFAILRFYAINEATDVFDLVLQV